MIQMERWGGVPTWHKGSRGSSCSQTSASKIVRGWGRGALLGCGQGPWVGPRCCWPGAAPYSLGRRRYWQEASIGRDLWHSAQHNPELGAGKGASLFESVSCLHCRLRTGDRGGGQKGGSGLEGQTLGLSILRFLSRPQILRCSQGELPGHRTQGGCILVFLVSSWEPSTKHMPVFID